MPVPGLTIKIDTHHATVTEAEVALQTPKETAERINADRYAVAQNTHAVICILIDAYVSELLDAGVTDAVDRARALAAAKLPGWNIAIDYKP